MAARIAHFGTDDLHRTLILKNAGYAVDICPTVTTLRSSLQNEDASAPLVAAVVFSDGHNGTSTDAIAVVRSHVYTPTLILFSGMNESVHESEFDLVIPPFTPPYEWIEQVQALITRSLALIAGSKSIHDRAELLRRESTALRQASALGRKRFAQQRAREDEPRKE